ncbi:MAG: hypothetical protein BWY77_00989 [bacterium ADurb.Bin431]|nr:MAG: hypothetical protein BWY77_00989 [bacterium ADurb.Bin431]
MLKKKMPDTKAIFGVRQSGLDQTAVGEQGFVVGFGDDLQGGEAVKTLHIIGGQGDDLLVDLGRVAEFTLLFQISGEEFQSVDAFRIPLQRLFGHADAGIVLFEKIVILGERQVDPC